MSLHCRSAIRARSYAPDMVRTWLALQSRLQLLGRERLQLISRRV
eukprot:COSAG06_NODE_50857_length_315_cov_20.537037_1_plen_44_part_10